MSLKVKNISKSYDKISVIDNVSYSFPENGLCLILGENGAGKSTLVKILSLYEKVDCGDIFINDIKINQSSNANYYRNNSLSIIRQNPSFLKNKDVLSNIKYYNNCIDKVSSLYDKFKINGIKNKSVNELSGGERQKVNILMHLNTDYEILICDEPFNNLDECSKKHLINELKVISSDKLVLLVTHNHYDYISYADTIIIVKNGKIEKVESKYSIDNQIEFNPKCNPINLFNQISNLFFSYDEVVIKKSKSITCMDTASNDETKIIKSSTVKNNIFTNISKYCTYFFLSFLLVFLMIFIFVLHSYDFSKVSWNSISKTESYVEYFFKDNEEYAPLKFSDLFDNEMYDELIFSYSDSENFNTNFDLLDPYNSNEISGVNYIDVDSIPLLCGVNPVSVDNVLITDYLAKQYFSIIDLKYDDIIGKEIRYGSKNYKISGIIKSDSEKYRSEIKDKKMYNKFVNKRKCYFSKIFIPKEHFNQVKSLSEYHFKFSSYNVDFVAKVVVDDGTKVDENNKFVINNTLYEYLKENMKTEIPEIISVDNSNIFTKQLNCDFEIDKIINDAKDELIIYVDSSVYDTIVNNTIIATSLISNNSISYEKHVELLNDYEFKTQNSDILYEINSLLTFLGENLNIYCIIMIIILFIWNYSYISVLCRKRYDVILLKKMKGFSVAKVYTNDFIKDMFIFSSFNIIIIILNLLFIDIFNRQISLNYVLDFKVLSIDFKYLVYIVLVFIFSLLFVYIFEILKYKINYPKSYEK